MTPAQKHQYAAAQAMADKLGISFLAALACMNRGAELRAAALATAAASERRAAVGNAKP